MSIANLLEDFGMAPDAPVTELGGQANDTELLDTFEQGYKAGWEDAVRATAEETAHVSAVLGRNLEQLSFTYHEARAALQAELAPVLETVARTILPKVAHMGLGLHLAEQLQTLVETCGEQNVRITVSPAETEAVQQLLPETLTFPVEVVSDPALGEGQARIDFGGREQQIDLGEMLGELTAAFEAFSHQLRKDRNVG